MAFSAQGKVLCPSLVTSDVDVIRLRVALATCQKYTYIINVSSVPSPKVTTNWPFDCVQLYSRTKHARCTRSGGSAGIWRQSSVLWIKVRPGAFAVMSGQPRFVSPFHRPHCLAAAVPAGKATFTHPGKAILAGKKLLYKDGTLKLVYNFHNSLCLHTG